MKKILIILVLIFGVGSALESFSTANAQDATDHQQFEGFNLKGYTDSGEEAWDVKGDTADVQGSEVTISNVNANAYGEEKVNVKASKGTLDQTSGNMRLEEDVVVTSERGAQLLTDHLIWDKQGDVVSTEDDVLITDDRMTVTGTGMTSQPGLKHAEIKQDVVVRVDTEPDEAEDQVLTITSDGPMVVDQATGVATFEDNVFVRRDDQTIKADKMEVYFDEELSQIKEIICIGGVEISRGENKTYADRAVYNAVTEKISLFGRPKLILKTEGEGSIATFRN